MINRLRKKEEYLKTVRRKVPPFWMSTFFDGYHKKYFEEFFDNSRGAQSLVVSDHMIYYLVEDIDYFARLTFDVLSRDLSELERVRKILDTREEKMMMALNESLESFIENLQSFVPALMIGFTMENILFDEMRNELSNKLQEKDVDLILDKLNTPLEDNFYRKAELDLAKNGVTSEHLKEYAWIKTRYGVLNPYTLDDAQSRLDEIDVNEFLEEYESQKKETKKVVRDAKKMLNEKSNLVDLMQFLVFYRTHRTEALNKAIYYAMPLLEKVAREKGLSYEEITHSTNREVLEDNIPDSEILRERINKYSIIADEKGVHVFHGDDNKKIVDFFKEEVEDVSEIKGSLACKGFMKGRVKIVLSASDFEKFQEGDILVAPMTTPDYVPIMKQAAAFVTDEGGITCHAAIVSREMKKPCIIGTKIATQVLKDGDLVEVDANEGKVRILKKAQNE